MPYVLRFFNPTALATAYGRRPQFVRAEHSATAEGENCAYGPTLRQYLHRLQPNALYCMEKQRKKQTQRQKNVLTMTSGGFMIAVRNNSFINSKQHFLEPTYVETISKALGPMNRLQFKKYGSLVLGAAHHMVSQDPNLQPEVSPIFPANCIVF